MYAETKRRTYLQLGVFIGAMGVLLTILGLFYVNSLVMPGYATQKAVILWGGLLLVCFSLRNVALGFPASRFASDSMWDTFSAVFANLFSLLISGAILGITLWAHIDYFKSISDVEALKDDLTLVNLISVLFLGTMSMLASLVGCIIACFPVSDAQIPEGGEDYAMENQGFNKH